MGFKGVFVCFVIVIIGVVYPLSAEPARFHAYEGIPDVAADGTMLPDSVWNTSSVVLDTHRITPTPSNNFAGDVAIGQYFKGTSDDTARVVAIYTQSYPSENLELVILTDTATSSFGQADFRRESVHSFTDYSRCPVALGDINGDEFTDIAISRPGDFWNKRVIVWIGWDDVSKTWIAHDSITITGRDIRDMVIGDADNDGVANEIFCSTYRWEILRAVWSETGWDTVFIPLDSARSCGVAIGDVRPDIPGNEVYVAGYDYPESRLWMVTWTGSDWESEEMSDFTWPGSNQIEEAKDVDVGDIDPLLPGNEVVVTHTHGGGGLPYSLGYQISIFNWKGSEWQARAWHWPDYYGLGGIYISIGDVIPENPGNEAIVTQDYVNAESKIFWLAPNGGAFMRGFYYPTYSTYVAIGDVNKFRDLGQEFVLAGSDGLVAVEAHDYVNDIGTYYYRMHNQTSTKNNPDTIQAVIFNAGSQVQTGFTVGYCFKDSPLNSSVTYSGTILPNDTGYVSFPITFDFLGFDTLYVYTDLTGDAYSGNDTVSLHIEVYDDSTQAASGFNHHIFPPVNGTAEPYDWQAIILSEERHQVNWRRYPQPQYPPGPTLEGYAGARSSCYGMPALRVARLRTHKFSTGDTPRRVFVTFYSFYAPWQGSVYGCSLYVGYSHDDVAYNTVWAMHDWQSPQQGWARHEIELGDFPAHTELYVGITSSTGGGGTDWFIDSVRVWTAYPTRHDAGMIDAYVKPRPVIMNDTFSVFTTIKNYGMDVLTSTQVFYTFGDADTAWETWSGSLAHNATEQHNFAIPCTRSKAQWDTLYVGTRLAYDEKAGNDVWSRPLEICDSVLLPTYTKDFDEEWENSIEPPYDGWKIIDGGTQSPPYVDLNDWHRYADSNYVPPRTIACIRYYPYETHDDWLISPRFDCTREGTYLLSYWHYYRDFYPTSPDSGRVLVSTDDGSTWTTVASYANWNYPGYDESHNITALVQGYAQVKIAFNYVATQEEYWHIDDFMLEYKVDTVPPAAPHVIHAQKSGTNLVLRWNKVMTDAHGSDELVTHYTVYRHTTPDYMPDVADSIGVVGHPGTTFTDVGALTSADDYYYLVKAVDDCANRSAKSNMGYKFNKQVNENAMATDKNWTSLPWYNNYSTVSDMTDDVSPTGDPVLKITSLRDDQLYESWLWDDLFMEWTGADFVIQSGEGYEFVAATDSFVVLVGVNDPAGLVQLNENPALTDKDLVSIPYNAVYSTVSDITDEYSPSGNPLIKITHLRDDQLYETRLWDDYFMAWAGYDFAIVSGCGYEFVTITDTVWDPTEFTNSGDRHVFSATRGSTIEIRNGTAVLSDRTPLWHMENGTWEMVNRELGMVNSERQKSKGKNANTRELREALSVQRQTSHIVRGHLMLKGCEDVVFTAYRPEQPRDVLTENMVGSGRVVRDGHVAVWFDVGNFANAWQPGEEMLVIIEAITDQETYFTVVSTRLDATVDIQELDIMSLEQLPHAKCVNDMAQWSAPDNEHVIGYAVYDDGRLLTDHLITGNLCRASGVVTVKPVITGGFETVYASHGVHGERDAMLPVSYAVSVLPNPFIKQTSIAYALPRSSAVKMAVYDPSGRKVKTLVRDTHPAGYYTAIWSGDDDHGRTVPAGVYFVHFVADDYCTINKATLLK